MLGGREYGRLHNALDKCLEYATGQAFERVRGKPLAVLATQAEDLRRAITREINTARLRRQRRRPRARTRP
jgi:hypothetical protein